MIIIHIIFSLKIGGAETMLVDIVNEQCINYNVKLIVINDLVDKHLISQISPKVSVILLNRLPKSFTFKPIIDLNKFLLKFKPNIIHCHHHNIIPLLLPLNYKKTFLTLHDTGINTKYLMFYKAIFAISESVQCDIIQRTSGNIQSVVVKNGVNLSNIKTKNELNINSKRIFKILQVSRLLHEKKGQDILLKALSKLTDIAVQIDFIGDGPSKNYLLQLTKDLGLEGRVQFLGEQTREFIHNTLKNYHLLVQPSLYEGFGLTVAEGMAAKIPVLVSDIEGPMEVIQKGKLGYYFKVGDYEDLSNKIIEIIKIYSTSNFISKIDTAYFFTLQNYNIKQTAQNYINAYKKTLNLD